MTTLRLRFAISFLSYGTVSVGSSPSEWKSYLLDVEFVLVFRVEGCGDRHEAFEDGKHFGVGGICLIV